MFKTLHIRFIGNSYTHPLLWVPPQTEVRLLSTGGRLSQWGDHDDGTPPPPSQGASPDTCFLLKGR